MLPESQNSKPSTQKLFSKKDNDTYYMLLALREAKKPKIDIPVGSILVRESQILGRGYNQREAMIDPTGHAELVALRKAAHALGSWRLTGCTLYSTLEPCPMCAEAIIQSRVSRLVFGAYDPISGAAGSAFNLFIAGRTLPVPDVIGGICEKKCQQLLVEHFKNRR